MHDQYTIHRRSVSLRYNYSPLLSGQHQLAPVRQPLYLSPSFGSRATAYPVVLPSYTSITRQFRRRSSSAPPALKAPIQDEGSTKYRSHEEIASPVVSHSSSTNFMYVLTRYGAHPGTIRPCCISAHLPLARRKQNFVLVHLTLVGLHFRKLLYVVYMG